MKVVSVIMVQQKLNYYTHITFRDLCTITEILQVPRSRSRTLGLPCV
jgi:hypothetical protein